MSKPREWYLNSNVTDSWHDEWGEVIESKKTRVCNIHVIEYSAYDEVVEDRNRAFGSYKHTRMNYDKAVAALKWLLSDTQHSDHDCGMDLCPVDTARRVLKELGELDE